MAVAMMVDNPEGTQEIYQAVVTPSGPTALLVTSASVQVGAVMLRRSGRPFPRPSTALLRWTFAVLVLAALATFGYLWALSVGPASAIVPLGATSPAPAGVVGALILRESRSRAQDVGVAVGMVTAVVMYMAVSRSSCPVTARPAQPLVGAIRWSRM